MAARFEAIEKHSDAGKGGAYFPAYLLKCLQDWFTWHGEEVYLELKAVRNAIDTARSAEMAMPQAGALSHAKGCPERVPSGAQAKEGSEEHNWPCLGSVLTMRVGEARAPIVAAKIPS